jgi:hypothetical protein
MVFNFKKNVSILCHLEIGDKVTTNNWGYKLDGKEHTIEDIKLGECESAVLVKIDGYDSFIDSGWLNKVIK